MKTDHDKTFKFKVDDTEFTTEVPKLTGLEIRQRASVDDGYQLFLEVHGGKEDKQIKDSDEVDFATPGIEKLYTVPPATFGNT